MTGTPPSTPAPLPTLLLVTDSYTRTLRALDALIVGRWPVWLALAAATFALAWLAYPLEHAAGRLGGSWPSLLVQPLITLVFAAMIGVPWVRHVLLDEPMPTVAQGPALSLEPRVLAYAIWSAALTLPMIIAAVLLPAGAGGDPKLGDAKIEATGADPLSGMISLALFVVWLFAIARLGLKLVGVALSDREATIEAIWQRTASNAWPLFGGLLLTLVPGFVLSSIIGGLEGSGGSAGVETAAQLTHAVVTTLRQLIESVVDVISLTFATLAYRHLMNRPRTV